MPLKPISIKYLKGLAILTLSSAAVSSPSFAQTTPQTPALRQAQYRPAVPDENTLARLVWSTMIALDNANRTNNYSVLNRLGSPQFQQRNSTAQLSQLFSDLRLNRVDVGRTILSTPTYYRPPEILADGSLRLRGGFDYRPKSVRFDLVYSNVNGGWRINALSVVEMDANAPK